MLTVVVINFLIIHFFLMCDFLFFAYVWMLMLQCRDLGANFFVKLFLFVHAMFHNILHLCVLHIAFMCLICNFYHCCAWPSVNFKLCKGGGWTKTGCNTLSLRRLPVARRPFSFHCNVYFVDIYLSRLNKDILIWFDFDMIVI